MPISSTSGDCTWGDIYRWEYEGAYDHHHPVEDEDDGEDEEVDYSGMHEADTWRDE